jgi:hypothetical protein
MLFGFVNVGIAASASKEAFRYDPGNIGQQSGRKTMRNITRIAAVKTNDNGAGSGSAVAAPIDFDSVNAFFGHWLSQRSREGTTSDNLAAANQFGEAL